MSDSRSAGHGHLILNYSATLMRLLREPAAALLVAAICFAASLACAQEKHPPAVWTPSMEENRQQGEDATQTFKVDVKLVSISVTVVDEHGAPVAGLTKDNFRITEDGVPQDLRVFGRESELPLSIVLALDASLSTRTNLKLERESARRFIHSIMRKQDALTLYQFDTEVLELVRFTSDLRTIDRGIDRVHVGAATALYDAVYLGSDALAQRQGRKVLVVITDGGDTMSQVSYAD